MAKINHHNYSQTHEQSSWSFHGDLSVIAGILVVTLIFLPPFMAGSHKCPVLREQALQQANTLAKPANARKYNVDCTYCHTVWPQLNREGLMFRYRGYRMAWEVPHHEFGQPVAGSTAAARATLVARLERVAEGERQFTAAQCFSCHAGGGNVIDPSKPIKGADFLKKFPSDLQVAKIIRNGVPGTAMPAYGRDRLSDDALANMIAYIRSLTANPR